jgi:hypothetical protein
MIAHLLNTYERKSHSISPVNEYDRKQGRGTASLHFKPDVRGHVAHARATADDIVKLCKLASSLSARPFQDNRERGGEDDSSRTYVRTT